MFQWAYADDRSFQWFGTLQLSKKRVSANQSSAPLVKKKTIFLRKFRLLGTGPRSSALTVCFNQPKNFGFSILAVPMPVVPATCSTDDFGRELRQRCPRTMIVFITGEKNLKSIKASVADCFGMWKPVNKDLLLKRLPCGDA
jgi:hypothetical protein